MDAPRIIEEVPIPVLSFVPLMDKGVAETARAEEMILHSDYSGKNKSDMMTSMAIFAGLIDVNLAANLLMRRKDIIMESSIYKEILNEGIEKGIVLGRKRGRKQLLMELLDKNLKNKFYDKAEPVISRIKRIQDIRKLESLLDIVLESDTLDMVVDFLNQKSDGKRK